MNWELIWIGAGAVCAILTIFGMLVTFAFKHVRLMIHGELADFLVNLDATYVRSAAYADHAADVERRLARLEART